MIVWLASYPRSGNTMTRLLMHYMYDVPTYDIYFTSPSDEFLQQDKLANLVGLKPLESMRELVESQDYCFVKTHELPSDDHPAIYIIRDGRDSLISHAHFIMAFSRFKIGFVGRIFAQFIEMVRGAAVDKKESDRRAFLDILRRLVSGHPGYGSWSKHVSAWSSRQAPTAIIRYEDLLVDPIATVQGAVTRLGIKLQKPKRTEPMSFPSLQKLDSRFFRKGKSGSYKDEMPSDIEELFWKHNGDAMRALGYANGPLRKAA